MIFFSFRVYCCLYVYIFCHISIDTIYYVTILTAHRVNLLTAVRSSQVLVCREQYRSLAWQGRKRPSFPTGRIEKAAVLESGAFVRRFHCLHSENIQETQRWEAGPASLDARYRSLCGRPIKVWIIYTPSLLAQFASAYLGYFQREDLIEWNRPFDIESTLLL